MEMFPRIEDQRSMLAYGDGGEALSYMHLFMKDLLEGKYSHSCTKYNSSLDYRHHASIAEVTKNVKHQL